MVKRRNAHTQKKGRNTTNMRLHLNNYHPEQLKQLQSEELKSSPVTSFFKSKSFGVPVHKKNPLPQNSTSFQTLKLELKQLQSEELKSSPVTSFFKSKSFGVRVHKKNPLPQNSTSFQTLKLDLTRLCACTSFLLHCICLFHHGASPSSEFIVGTLDSSRWLLQCVVRLCLILPSEVTLFKLYR